MNFVTGGTGFVGWHVVRQLVERGEKVRALVQPSTTADFLEALPGVEVVRGSLLDGDGMAEKLEGCSRLFHVAALYTFWLRDPQLMYETNVAGTEKLISAAAQANVERIVYTSTVGALGLHADRTPADEETDVSLNDMVGHYKRSKFLAEEKVKQLAASGTPVIIVNPSAPVGAADRKPTPTGQMIVDFMRGKMKAYLDTGLNVVDVEDVAAGHLLAADRGKVGERYILGNQNLHLKQIFTILAQLTGIRAPRRRVPYTMAWSAAAASTAIARVTGRPPAIPLESVKIARKTMFFSARKAVDALGLPQTAPEVALEKAVKWFRDEGYA